jgi:hypothetical protein
MGPCSLRFPIPSRAPRSRAFFSESFGAPHYPGEPCICIPTTDGETGILVTGGSDTVVKTSRRGLKKHEAMDELTVRTRTRSPPP